MLFGQDHNYLYAGSAEDVEKLPGNWRGLLQHKLNKNVGVFYLVQDYYDYVCKAEFLYRNALKYSYILVMNEGTKDEIDAIENTAIHMLYEFVD